MIRQTYTLSQPDHLTSYTLPTPKISGDTSIPLYFWLCEGLLPRWDRNKTFWSNHDSQLRQICFQGIQKKTWDVMVFSGFCCVSIRGRKGEREVGSWCREGKRRLIFLVSQTIIDYCWLIWRSRENKAEPEEDTSVKQIGKKQERRYRDRFKWHNKG